MFFSGGANIELTLPNKQSVLVTYCAALISIGIVSSVHVLTASLRSLFVCLYRRCISVGLKGERFSMFALNLN